MGRLLLIRRLVTKDIRHRPAQALLLVLAIAAAATTLTLGLALRGATDNPFGQTQSATNGPDVIAALMPTTVRSGNQADPGQLAALEHAPGVAAGSGPFPVTWTLLQWVTRGTEPRWRGAVSDRPRSISRS